MAEGNQFRTIVGFVKYEPREATVTREGEKVTVRNIVVRQTGVKDQAIDVRATLWPSHEDFEVEQGDFVALEGRFTVNEGETDEGEKRTYFNLSVAAALNFGSSSRGNRSEVAGRVADEDEESPSW